MDNEKLISALKNGNVPSNNLSSFCIGREKEIETFESILEKVKEGKAVTKFIHGEYGAGKSFF